MNSEIIKKILENQIKEREIKFINRWIIKERDRILKKE